MAICLFRLLWKPMEGKLGKNRPEAGNQVAVVRRDIQALTRDGSKTTRQEESIERGGGRKVNPT